MSKSFFRALGIKIVAQLTKPGVKEVYICGLCYEVFEKAEEAKDHEKIYHEN